MTRQVKRKFYLKEFKAISRAVSNYEDLNLLFTHIVEGLCRTFSLKGCCILFFRGGFIGQHKNCVINGHAGPVAPDFQRGGIAGIGCKDHSVGNGKSVSLPVRCDS